MITTILLGIIGPWQIVLIVLVVLLLFGGKKIPELMRGLGKGVREFKDGINPDDSSKEKNDSVDKKEKS
jgi:sec-independent protein translocase protein TatA